MYNNTEAAALIELAEALGGRCVEFPLNAKFDFPNGLSLSVLSAPNAYSSEGTCELAVVRDGRVVYSPANGWGDVRGWVDFAGATVAMGEVSMADPAEFTTEMR